jgi:hypothetical protein
MGTLQVLRRTVVINTIVQGTSHEASCVIRSSHALEGIESVENVAREGTVTITTRERVVYTDAHDRRPGR